MALVVSPLSIYIPALNEEKELQNTINNIVGAAKEILDNYEIILVNDGSSDRTAEIIDENAGKNQNFKVIHHLKPLGLRSTFFECMSLAKYENVSIVPGDNPWSYVALKNLFNSVNNDILVIGYRVNLKQNRKLWRTVLAKGLALYCSLLTGVYLRDIHGATILPVKYFNKLEQWDSIGIGYQAEFVVRLLRMNVRYAFTPLPINPDMDESSNMNLNVIKDVVKTLVLLTLHRN